MKIKRFLCPACKSPTKINGSRAQHSLLRRSYAQCQNPLCGASWQLNIEIASAASPVSDLFAEQVKPLRIPVAETADQVLDLAMHFIANGNKKWSRDEAMAHCVTYLLKYVSTISRATAEMTAARAIAELESVACSHYTIDIDRCTSTSIIINRNPSALEMQCGRSRESHVVSLREIVELIEQRIAADEDGRLI